MALPTIITILNKFDENFKLTDIYHCCIIVLHIHALLDIPQANVGIVYTVR